MKKIKTCILELDVLYSNGLIFERGALERELDELMLPLIGGPVGFNSQQHVSEINLQPSHQVNHIWIDGNCVNAEIETLETSDGKILEEFLQLSDCPYCFRPYASVNDSVKTSKGWLVKELFINSINYVPSNLAIQTVESLSD